MLGYKKRSQETEQGGKEGRARGEILESPPLGSWHAWISPEISKTLVVVEFHSSARSTKN